MHQDGTLKAHYKDVKKEFLQARHALKSLPRDGMVHDFLVDHVYGLKEEMAWTLLDMGEYEKGLSLYKSLPSGESKFNGMIRAYMEMEYYDEARKLIDKGLRRFPESYGLWVAKGMLNQKLGYDLESFKCFQSALKYAPSGRLEALYDMATSLSKMGHHVEALKLYKRLVKKDPSEPMYLMALGSCLLDLKYPREALRYYKKAYETGGLCVGIFEGFFHSFMSMGLKEAALEVALEGLKEFPDEDPLIYAMVGAAYFEMDWANEAKEILNQGLKKFPGNKGLKEILEEIDEDPDDPDGNKSALLGLVLLKALRNKKYVKRS
ncbi:MAG: hypothetical protein A2156_01080 [Deltaproteobacteria bacterium RBG_16_48_10]|nr:MAG: hypothetical protein A2156_01080 [Deltaproteobacteria bacterium RBG_16_48_10]